MLCWTERGRGQLPLPAGRCIELGAVCCSLGRDWVRRTCLPSVGDSGAAGSSHRRPYLTSAKYFGFHLQLSLVQCARSNGDALTSRDRKGHNFICKPDTHECMCAESDPLKCIDLSSGNWFVQTKIDFPRFDKESSLQCLGTWLIVTICTMAIQCDLDTKFIKPLWIL